MADFPMEPQLAKVLIASVEFKCSDEILTIVAMLSVPSVFYWPSDKQTQADAKKAKFHQPEGDHLTLLATYDGWKASRFSDVWCAVHFIQAEHMRHARDVRTQLVGIMDRHKHEVVGVGRDRNRVRQVICSGFFRNAAVRYLWLMCHKALAEDALVYIHPLSALYRHPPQWCVYHEVVCTTREY